MTIAVMHVLEAVGGGTARHVIDLVRHAHGVHHTVVVPRERIGWLHDSDAITDLTAAGADVRFVEMRRLPPHPRNLAALGQLTAMIRGLSPDLVHGHSSVGGALARLVGLVSRVPRLYTPNSISPTRAATALERLMGPLTDRLIAVSPSEAEYLRALRLVDAHRLVTIRNGIDLELTYPPALDLRASLGLSAQTPLVGTVSRLVPQKAPEQFARMAARVANSSPDTHFVLIGDGAQQAAFDAEVSALGIGDRLHVLPPFSRPAGVMDQFDVYVSTSRYEGGPYAPLEAMRAGTAVVATDAIGNRDAVEHRVTGLLAPVGDHDSLARATVELIDNRELRQSLVTAARVRLTELFDVRVQGAATAAVYRELAG